MSSWSSSQQSSSVSLMIFHESTVGIEMDSAIDTVSSTNKVTSKEDDSTQRDRLSDAFFVGSGTGEDCEETIMVTV